MCRLLVLRYGHWAVATPMIVYLISRLSNFTIGRTVRVVLAQTGVIVTGFLALVLPLQFECEQGSISSPATFSSNKEDPERCPAVSRQI